MNILKKIGPRTAHDLATLALTSETTLGLQTSGGLRQVPKFQVESRTSLAKTQVEIRGIFAAPQIFAHIAASFNMIIALSLILHPCP